MKTIILIPCYFTRNIWGRGFKMKNQHIHTYTIDLTSSMLRHITVQKFTQIIHEVRSKNIARQVFQDRRVKEIILGLLSHLLLGM
jgi:hypothetical protein